MQKTNSLAYAEDFYEVEYEGFYDAQVVRRTRTNAKASVQRDRTRTAFAKQTSKQRKLQRNTYGVKGGK